MSLPVICSYLRMSIMTTNVARDVRGPIDLQSFGENTNCSAVAKFKIHGIQEKQSQDRHSQTDS
jgi:hypothetical protein